MSFSMSSALTEPVDLKAVNRRIFSAVAFTFVTYLSIGVPLAVLPGYVHNHLGFSNLTAGIVISIHYFFTLLSRPHAGRYADLLGPKKVVMIGMTCCGLSGVFYLFSTWTDASPWLSLGVLCLGRAVLGVGESFGSTGSTLWGIGDVGSEHTARVISWNGVSTYSAMAIGAPIGVWIYQHAGLWGVGLLLIVAAAIALFFSFKKAAVSVRTGKRISFAAVVGRIWMFGLGLGLGTIGFGVIATYITVFFADHHWSGAAFSLTLFSVAFAGMRLVFPNAINRHGGLRVSMYSFVFEIIGLLLIWWAVNPVVVDIAAFMTGAGFSLVFPALGVEAVQRVESQNQGTALGTYSAFLDLGLGITGPLAGLLITRAGIDSIYLAAAVVVFAALLLTSRLLMLQHRRFA
jgi:MFS family permease